MRSVARCRPAYNAKASPSRNRQAVPSDSPSAPTFTARLWHSCRNITKARKTCKRRSSKPTNPRLSPRRQKETGRTTSSTCSGQHLSGQHRTQPDGTTSSWHKGTWCSSTSSELSSSPHGNTTTQKRCSSSTSLLTANATAHASPPSPTCSCSGSATRTSSPSCRPCPTASFHARDAPSSTRYNTRCSSCSFPSRT